MYEYRRCLALSRSASTGWTTSLMRGQVTGRSKQVFDAYTACATKLRPEVLRGKVPLADPISLLTHGLIHSEVVGSRQWRDVMAAELLKACLLRAARRRGGYGRVVAGSSVCTRVGDRGRHRARRANPAPAGSLSGHDTNHDIPRRSRERRRGPGRPTSGLHLEQ